MCFQFLYVKIKCFAFKLEARLKQPVDMVLSKNCVQANIKF